MKFKQLFYILAAILTLGLAPTARADNPLATDNRLYGVTVDSISSLPNIVNSLQTLGRKPTTRIVFDENVPASEYTAAAAAIHKVSYVMGEILDSFYMKTYSVPAYLARTTEYLNALGDNVDIWEVGNEINGEWLGNKADTIAKMTGAFDLVKAQGKKTELTLYYNKGCFSKASNEMFTWAAANVPARMKTGLDYVLVSYYEDDCNDLQPDWPTVFSQLSAMFPNSKVGFGEVGTKTASKKASFITRYYGLSLPNVPNYVGGYFWWYGKQDIVPSTKALWTTLNTAIMANPRSVTPLPPPAVPNPPSVSNPPPVPNPPPVVNPPPVTTPPPVTYPRRRHW